MTHSALAMCFMLPVIACGAATTSPIAPGHPEVAASASVADAPPATCGELFRRGSFCDELAELSRLTREDSAMRRCLRVDNYATTSALTGITMTCQAHPPWDADCAGNPAGKSDLVVICRLTTGYEYDDKAHDPTNYVRSAAAAVAACDPAYHASPLRPQGARDQAVVLSRPADPGSSLKRVVAVCSALGDLPPSEEEGRPEVVPAHYNVVLQIYGAAP